MRSMSILASAIQPGRPLAPVGAVAELILVDVASTNFFRSPVGREP